MSSLLTPGALHRAVADNDTAAAARLLRRGGVAASGRAARADSPSAGAPSAIGAADAVTTPGLDGRSALRLATLLAGRDQILRLMHNAAGPGVRVGPHPKPIATMSPPPPLGARLPGARARIADVVGAAAVAGELAAQAALERLRTRSPDALSAPKGATAKAAPCRYATP